MILRFDSTNWYPYFYYCLLPASWWLRLLYAIQWFSMVLAEWAAPIWCYLISTIHPSNESELLLPSKLEGPPPHFSRTFLSKLHWAIFLAILGGKNSDLNSAVVRTDLSYDHLKQDSIVFMTQNDYYNNYKSISQMIKLLAEITVYINW